MSITFDPEARDIYWQQMQRICEWLLSSPPFTEESLGPASRNEMVLNYLDKTLQFGDSALHLRLLDNFAASLQHSSSLPVLDKHLTIALTQPEMPNALRVKLSSLHARLLIQRGELQRAEQVLQVAWPAADTPPLAAELYNRTAVLLEVKEKYIESQEAYMRGLALATESGTLYQVTLIYNNLGNWASIQKRYEEAQRYYQKALQVAEELNDPTHCARAEGGLAMTLGILEQYEAAEQYHQAAREHYSESGNHFGVIRIDLNRSYFALLQGKYPQAKQLANQARITAQRYGNLQYEGTARHNLGRIFLREGDYETAYKHLAQALEIRQGLGRTPYVKKTIEVIQNLAQAIENHPNYDSELKMQLQKQCQALLKETQNTSVPPYIY